MIIREIKPEDVAEVFTWMADRKWPQPAVADIAPKFGIVAEREGKLLACLYSYLTGSSIAFIEWTATNPSVDSNDSANALMLLFEHMKKMCDVSDPKVRALCLYTQNDKFADQLASSGFKKTQKFYRLMWIKK